MYLTFSHNVLKFCKDPRKQVLYKKTGQERNESETHQNDIYVQSWCSCFSHNQVRYKKYTKIHMNKIKLKQKWPWNILHTFI